MWQTKYASAVPKNLGVGVDFRPCSEDHFLTGTPVRALEQLISCLVKKVKSEIFKQAIYLYDLKYKASRRKKANTKQSNCT